MALKRDTSETTDDRDRESESKRDPRQLILPHVDTSTTIYKGRSLRELLPYVPGAVLFAVGGISVLYVPVQWAVVAFLAAIPCWFVARMAERKTKRLWYRTPAGLCRDWWAYFWRVRTIPWGADHVSSHPDDIRHIRRDEDVASPGGSAERRDGSYAALVRVHGRITHRLPMYKRHGVVRSLTSGIEENMRHNWWAFYSGARQSSGSAVADERKTRADDTLGNELSDTQRESLRDSAAWIRERDDEHEANAWHDYVVVEADLRDLPVAPPGSIGSRVRHISSRLERLIASVSPRCSPSSEGWEDDQITLEDLLEKRIEDVDSALSGVRGLRHERASAAEHARVLQTFWTDDATARVLPEDGSGDGDKDANGAGLMELFERAREDADGRTPTERMIQTGYRDTDSPTTLRHGEGPTYSRTFWISEWSPRPEALFLKELYRMGGIDLDVKINVQQIPRDAAMDALTDLILDIDAEGIERAKKADVDALTIDDKLRDYIKAFKALDRREAAAWRLSGYVVVRADSRRELRDDADAVRDVLKSDPAGTYPVASGTNQRAAFASAAPFSRDRFEAAESGERTHIALSGAFGAMFPFGTVSINEPGGMVFGRNTQTGGLVVADPWQRGTAPHMNTIGWSGCGKTTLVEEVTAGWFLDQPTGEDPRTLIVIDTQEEFGDLTRLCEGEHIPIGAKQPLNPMRITEIPPEEREKMRERGEAIGDPLASKIAEFTQFVGNLILTETRNADGRSDVDIPWQLINYAASKTYERAGIYHDDLDSHAEPSPAPKDFVAMLGEMREKVEESGEHTFHSTDGEIEGRIGDIDLLLNNLIGFLDGGKFDHLWDTAHTGILDEGTRMAYLDCSAFRDRNDAEKSVAFQQAWSEVAQKVKQAPGKTVVVADEAHVMYQSPMMIEWLEDASREWRRYGGCLWSVSQSPQEFVTRQTGVEAGGENKRQVVLEQSSTTMIGRMNEKTKDSTLRAVGLDGPTIKASKEELTPGEAEKGYSTFLVEFGDRHGWVEVRIETLPFVEYAEPGEETLPEMSVSATETPAAADGGVTEVEVDGTPVRIEPDGTAARIRAYLYDRPELVYEEYRPEVRSLNGACYLAAEAYYHASGGRDSNLEIYCLSWSDVGYEDGGTHWFLRDGEGGPVIDLGLDERAQASDIPYGKGRHRAFITGYEDPSKRTKTVLNALGECEGGPL